MKPNTIIYHLVLITGVLSTCKVSYFPSRGIKEQNFTCKVSCTKVITVASNPNGLICSLNNDMVICSCANDGCGSLPSSLKCK
ncbi:hypothetical protein K502DRAFT_324397 [Neoconidiobolus thromboides FSU 785]|nr:hypothetical protein K502DRAFT_324397 [Neoconidiobolus thromboides FSU 785]